MAKNTGKYVTIGNKRKLAFKYNYGIMFISKKFVT